MGPLQPSPMKGLTTGYVEMGPHIALQNPIQVQMTEQQMRLHPHLLSLATLYS